MDTIDLRITRAGWARAKEDFGRDTAVRRPPSVRTGSGRGPGGIDTDSAAGVSAQHLSASSIAPDPSAPTAQFFKPTLRVKGNAGH
jgi:hypothetical protein